MIERINGLTNTAMMSTNPPVMQTEDSDSFEVTLSYASADHETLICSEDLEEIFQQASETYGISIDLLKAVAKAESDFDPDCTSSSGAMGIMQLMPATAKELGVTDAYDPEQNIMAGAKYLAENMEIFNGDISLATAAYNAGRGAVKKYSGIPPYTETQNYVKKILGFLDENITVPDITGTQKSGYTATYTEQAHPVCNHKITEKEKNAIEKLSANTNSFILTKLYKNAN